jgi:hypothetical protein
MGALSAEIDSLIRSSAGPQWLKVAMIISRVMLASDRHRNPGDEYLIAGRIRALVESGQLEAQGNLSKWRHGEVKLPR